MMILNIIQKDVVIKGKLEYNKDAGMYVCKTRHMAIKKHFKKEMNTIIIQKSIIISLTWKNVNIVHLKMVAIKRV